MADGYKHAKEAFVSNMTGSSIGHINLISSVALASVSLYAALRTRLAPRRRVGFLCSWTLLVLPLLLSMTLFANAPHYLATFLLLPTLLLLRLQKPEDGTPLPSSQPTTSSAFELSQQLYQSTSSNVVVGNSTFAPLPALTTYRTHMMLMTVLAILAVDFPVFPRSLVKCETYGVSLMDLGVGSFVFAQGIVSAIPLVKDPHYIRAPFLSKVYKVTSKSLPIIALGLIRVLLVKGTDYPEHVTEYGVHWNFFITLALLPVMQVILHPILQRHSISFVGVVVGLLQQLFLSRLSLKEYILNAPRISIISANKEGIVSLLGYLSIQLLGLSVGTIILPPTPSFFRRRQNALLEQDKNRRKHSNGTSSSSFSAPSSGLQRLKLSTPRQTGKTATDLCAYAILWWGFLGLLWLVGLEGKWGPEGGISRRMVNLPYILWVTAFNTSFLLSYLLVLDMWIFADSTNASVNAKNHHVGGIPKIGRDVVTSVVAENDRRKSGYPFTPKVAGGATNLGNPPMLFEVINKHGLAIFLIANLFTGLINILIPTMYLGNTLAMLVLSAYSMAICAVGWFWPSHWHDLLRPSSRG